MKKIKYSLWALAAAVLLLGAVEGVLRLTSNYSSSPGYVFRPEAGFVFDPATAPNRVNSMGFIDKQRDPGASDRPRVLLLGDSFVAGTTLASHLETRLGQALGEPVEVIPMGFPGVGMGNMLAYYEAFGRAFKPKAVVVVFNASTFANNSPLLYSLKIRPDPRATDSFFMVRDPDGQCRRIAPSPDFSDHRLAELPLHMTPTLGDRIDAALDGVLGWSYGYNWLKDSIRQQDDKGFLSQDHTFAYRLAQLRAVPEFAASFEGWAYPDDLDMNMMFWTETAAMPPVFKDALAGTECLLRTFGDASRADDFAFLIVVGEDCAVPTSTMRAEFDYRAGKSGRKFVEAGNRKKIMALARQAEVEALDLAPIITPIRDKAHPPGDIHLTESGNEAAAGAISDALIKRTDFSKMLAGRQ